MICSEVGDDGDGDGRRRSVASYPSSGWWQSHRIVFSSSFFLPVLSSCLIIFRLFIFSRSTNETHPHPKTNDRYRSRASRTAIIDDVFEGQKAA